MQAGSVLEQMLDSFPGIDSLLPPTPPNEVQKAQLDELVAGVLRYREYRQLTRGLLEAQLARSPLEDKIDREKRLEFG